MALFKSQVLTQASGSVGGMTYTRTSSGLTLRARSVPISTVSAELTAVKNNLTAMSLRWSQSMSDADRAAWAVYAANTLTTNALGDSLKLTGQQQYIANNTPRLQSGLPLVDPGPTAFGLTNLSPVTLDAPLIGGGASLNFDNSDDWAITDGGGLLLFITRPVPLARNFVKGPYRFAQVVPGDTSTPPTTGIAVNFPFPGVTGQKFFWRAYATDSTGRLSGVQTGSVIYA